MMSSTENGTNRRVTKTLRRITGRTGTALAAMSTTLLPTLATVLYVVYPVASLWLFRLPEQLSWLHLFQNHHQCSQTLHWHWKACVGLVLGHGMTLLPGMGALWLWIKPTWTMRRKVVYASIALLLGLVTFKLSVDHLLLFPLPSEGPSSSLVLQGKVAVITGANRGIGLATAMALADRGAHVVVTCRTAAKCQPVVQNIQDRGGSAQAAALDLSSLESAAQLAHHLSTDYPEIHYIFCNAGTTPQYELTKEGFEDGFGGMHLAHMTVVLGILPNLERASRKTTTTTTGTAVPSTTTTEDPSRVVIVSSEMSINAVMGIFGNHLIFSNPPIADVDVDGTSTTSTTTLEQDMMDDWRGERTRGDGRIGPSLPAYGRAKLCGILFALELNRRMKGRGVIAHAVHTGAVVTDSSRGSIVAAFPSWIPGLRWIIAHVYFPLLWRSVEGGARSLLCPALSHAAYILQGGQYLDALCRPFLHDFDPNMSQQQQFTLPLKEELRTIQMDPAQALLLADIKWSEPLWNVSIAFLQDSPARPFVAAAAFAP